MEINVYQDYLSKEEIEFLTGRKQKSMIVEQLNIMGIPFKLNANGYPVVRRNYDELPKHRANQVKNSKTQDWRPAVLQV